MKGNKFKSYSSHQNFTWHSVVYSLILIAVLVSFCFIGPTRVQAQEKMHTVVVENYYPPFSFLDENGELTGFDLEIVKAVCDQLKIKYEIKTMTFAEILLKLEKGEIDIACVGMAPTPERQKKFIFTNRYFRSNSLFLEMSKKYPGNSPAEIKGARVGVQAGTTQEMYLKKNYGTNITIVLIEDLEETFKALRAGTIDLGFIDGLPGYYYLTKDEGMDFDILGAPLKLSDQSCMGLPFGQEKLRDDINQAIDYIRSSGKYDEISRKYFNFDVY